MKKQIMFTTKINGKTTVWTGKRISLSKDSKFTQYTQLDYFCTDGDPVVFECQEEVLSTEMSTSISGEPGDSISLNIEKKRPTLDNTHMHRKVCEFLLNEAIELGLVITNDQPNGE